MQKRVRPKREIVKKVTALNLYADQANQIRGIMEVTGAQEVAPVLRQLLDEALAARRRKFAPVEPPEQPPTDGKADALQIIQTLLLKLIAQAQTAYRIESVTLELLQEALTEGRATRLDLWESLKRPSLTEKGKSPREIAELFEAKTVEAQDFAYGLAEEIKNQLLAVDAKNSETKSTTAAIDGNDRQGILIYDLADSPVNIDAQAP